MKRYNPLEIEQKWQDIWLREKSFSAINNDETRSKIYTTEMFPYPSGAGLHVGHVRNFTIVDVLARFYRQKGYNVLRPIGWDTFGLPAENYAIKNGESPKITTVTNIRHFKEQYQRLGMAVDWSREINTSNPDYYKWTEWCFLQLFKNGLAYQKESYQWWCPVDKTILANEQVEGGKCWRCGSLVEKKNMKQWFFRITEYADELLDGLDRMDWPERIKTMQRNWIGRSRGAEIHFSVDGIDDEVRVFTTRPDTIFGVSAIVLAPEHKLLSKLVSPEQSKAVDNYCKEALAKSEIARQSNKDKTGVFTGFYATNPINGDKLPIWVADYVLSGYGDSAIMLVPAHDERDNQFARKYELPMIKVIDDGSDEDFTQGEGLLINSGKFTGLRSAVAREKILEQLSIDKKGHDKTSYKMRDWLISRQRYWGVPIPIIHCDDCGAVPVPEKDLPVILPDIDDYHPSGDGRSPLAKVTSWVNTVCPVCGKSAKRETDTMDGYACSSWYIYRYIDPRNSDQAWDPKLVNYWAPLDFYVGGDHAVAHLLYIRFWAKFFHKQGLLAFDEPVKRLLYNGYINAPDGFKMSKSKGNVIDPLDIIDSGYGADTLRVYEMFIGPYELDAAWSTGGIGGVYRFLNRCWSIVQEYMDSDKVESLDPKSEKDLLRSEHTAIKKVTEDLHNNQFNTAVSYLMEYINALSKLKDQGFDRTIWKEALLVLAQLLGPFAPHIASELHSILSGENIVGLGWPDYDDSLLITDTVTIAVQVNGKLRGELEVSVDDNQSTIEDRALALENVSRFTEGHEIVKKIYVPKKILNLVVK